MNFENILKDITNHERERIMKYDVSSKCMICGEKLGNRQTYVSVNGETGWVCPQCLEELKEGEE